MKRLITAVLAMVALMAQAQSGDSIYNKVKSGVDYRSLAPMTFYRSVAEDVFSLDTDPATNNRLLLMEYLRHPELIENTQRAIDQAGPIEEKLTGTMVSDANLVEKVEPQPDDVSLVPVELVVKKPRFWSYKGDYSLQFMQSYVSGNWYKGGESNYAALGAVSMEANYNNRQKVKWDNKLEMKLGLQNLRTDTVHPVKSTEDLLRFTSKLGLQASKQWYYTLQMIAQSQFTHSYKSNDPIVYSDFLAPLKVDLSLGMDYNVDWMNHHLKGTFHMAPVAYNIRYTRRLELCDRLGFDEGKHWMKDYGSQFTVDLTWEFSEIIRWKTRMYGFTSYKRAEFEWENTFVFQLNKWLSAQLFVYPRFDDAVTRDGHHGYWQYQEFSSIGLTYSF